METKKYKYLSITITAVSSVISLIYYTLTVPDRYLLVYIQSAACAVVPILFMLIRRHFKTDFPISVDIAVAVYIVLANSFGTTLMFYGKFPFWDLVMHGTFGLLGVFLAEKLFFVGKGIKSRILQFLTVMGMGAIWEIFEFSCDMIIGTDTQRVALSMQNGENPIMDTMGDLCITVVGIAVYLIIRKIIDKATER